MDTETRNLLKAYVDAEVLAQQTFEAARRRGCTPEEAWLEAAEEADAAGTFAALSNRIEALSC